MSSSFKYVYICSKVFTFVMAVTIAFLTYIRLDSTLPWNVNITFTDWKNALVQKRCNDTKFPSQLNTEGNWGVVDVNETIYVISAYYVLERERVFIIGTKPFFEVSVICQLWYTSFKDNRRHVQQTLANVVAPIGATAYNFTSTIYECKVQTTEKQPEYVSLVMASCEIPRNLLKVRDASKPDGYQRRFTVCLSPVFKYDNIFQMVEWVELNRILGAEKFVFYNYSTGVNVNNAIEYYVKLGLIDVIQWNLPFPDIERNIEYFAQKAAINDCIFRNKNVSEFIVNIDKDEYIIPHSNDIITWSQLIDKFNKNYAGYVVRHSFFRLDWKLKNQNFSEKRFAEKYNLVTLTHFEHEKKIWPPNHRSKYFARAEVVEFGNVHEIPRGRIFIVPPELALVHHYRNIGKPEDHDKVIDFTVLVKYGDNLSKHVQKTWKALSIV
ncbi:uncharacterized protein LOC132748795 [Ruditapes philippinarum]|uniref:uncharacterized protein LOC132748795 n=1 Tax=Ruditapes philippinarum TaxID=129788 RepID=UPI00295AACBD|nr:uncharacterized protein LOC132748795 [Ruditapes philippinarum]